MSVAKFEKVLKREILSNAERKWFLIWLKRYARFCRQSGAARVSVGRKQTIRFLVELKNQGKRVWQRLQVVAALQLYRQGVLGCEKPSLVPQFTIDGPPEAILTQIVTKYLRPDYLVPLDIKTTFWHAP